MVLPTESKVGVFVDISNIYSNDGSRMRYDILRQYARSKGVVQRLNAYGAIDAERGDNDRAYYDGICGFHDALRELGFHLQVKDIHFYMGDDGRRTGKADWDVQICIDAMQQSDKLDYVILVSGDGDFTPLVIALQQKGIRVEVIALENVSQLLRKTADVFTNGYLIPELIPTTNRKMDQTWGEVGSTVRGFCYFHHNEKNFGFLSFLKELSADSWNADPRSPGSPFQAVFFNDAAMPVDVNPGFLPNRRQIFEYELGMNGDRLIATNIRLVDSNRSDSNAGAFFTLPETALVG